MLVFFLAALNFALRYFELPNYFFVAGFRFYGIIFLVGIFIFFYHGIENLKVSFHSMSLSKVYKFLFPILLPPLLIIGTLFFLKKIELGDPDYFYELGLSSIVDFPIYAIWNFPQFFILFHLLATIESSFKLKVVPNLLMLVCLFSAELFIPPKFSFDSSSIISFAIFCVAAALFLNKRENVLAFTFYFFSSIWLALLLFGTKSETLLQLFLAKTYTSWDGFFEIDKKLTLFIFPVYSLLTFLPLLFLKKEKPKE